MGLVWHRHAKQMRYEKKMKKIRLPLLAKIIIAIFVGVLVGQFAPEFVIRSMNTFCGLFDQLLCFMIPLIIVGLVTPAIAEVGDRAGRLLVLTVALAYFFTVCSGLFAYGFSTTLFPRLIDT
jgi:Na+/H+-dicarboxylate symporter